MLSILCNTNLGEEDCFRSSVKSYSNLAEEAHVKNLNDNKELFSGIVSELISVLKETTDASLTFDRVKKTIGDENKLDYVSVAISCLQLFAQVNWLGPVPVDLLDLPPALQQNKDLSLDNHIFNLVDYFPLKSQEYEQFEDKVRDVLSIDGETLFPVVKCPHLLFIARLIFLDLSERFADIQFFSWWSLRTIYLYQQLLEERSATLFKMTTSFLQTMENFFSDLANENGMVKNLSKKAVLFASIIYNLEAGHIQYQIYNWTAGQECFRKALKLSEFSYEFIGLYGKRTRYQQKDLAQLFLRVETNKSDESKEQEEFFNSLIYSNSDLDSKLIPKNVALNDDTLLDKIKLKNKEDEEMLNINRTISQLEQIVFFNCLFDFQKNNAVHELTLEELSPIIEYLLSHPQNWCVQVCTLFTRAKLEVKNSRRMERSLYQMESLWDGYRQPSEQPALKQRLPFFYSVSYPSFWILQKQLAKIYMQLGMVNSSLEIYLRLKMWEDVIICYQALDKRDKAEEVIRQQLAIKETPDLYCSLGEATRNVEHFHKAIELSKGRSARAYRLLAKFCFAKQEYDEAIVNFEKSLEINPMQYDAWFMLGSAAFRTEKWPTSIKAFKSCTNLDPDNYQNWNNLAASYTKINQKSKAYAVFQEALKYDYENWKMWENFLWTSTDCGYFEDVIKSYHRLLDLKEKYVEIDVLKALSSATRNHLNDANDVPIAKYKQKLLELFGRLTSLAVSDWQVYWYYAETVLALADEQNSGVIDQQTAEKYFGLVQKAFRNLYNQNNWEMSVDKCKEVVKYSTEILKRCNQYGKCLSAARETFGSVYMSMKSIISKLKQKYKVDEENSTPNQVKLLYLKDVNEDFVEMQVEYEAFNKQFFAA